MTVSAETITDALRPELEQIRKANRERNRKGAMTVQRAIEISQGGDKPPLNAKGPQMTTTSEAPPLLLLKGEDMLQNFQTYVNPQYGVFCKKPRKTPFQQILAYE